MKILVLDDEENLRTLLCDNLSFEGLDSVQAATGKEALEIASSGRLDLAVIDIGLPDMSGWKVCQGLKSDPKTRDIPVIVLSGSVGHDMDALAKSYGVDHWVSKPYDCGVLVELVKHSLECKGKH